MAVEGKEVCKVRKEAEVCRGEESVGFWIDYWSLHLNACLLIYGRECWIPGPE